MCLDLVWILLAVIIVSDFSEKRRGGGGGGGNAVKLASLEAAWPRSETIIKLRNTQRS